MPSRRSFTDHRYNNSVFDGLARLSKTDKKKILKMSINTRNELSFTSDTFHSLNLSSDYLSSLS